MSSDLVTSPGHTSSIEWITLYPCCYPCCCSSPTVVSFSFALYKLSSRDVFLLLVNVFVDVSVLEKVCDSVVSCVLSEEVNLLTSFRCFVSFSFCEPFILVFRLNQNM